MTPTALGAAPLLLTTPAGSDVPGWQAVGDPVHRLVARSDDADAATGAVAALRPDERTVFCLDFRRDRPLHLLGAAAWEPADAADVVQEPTAAPALPAWQVTATPSGPAYADAVRTALEVIATGRLRKVVLGRWLDLAGPVDDMLVPALVARLRRQSPHAHVLAVPHVDTAGRPATVVGASPELLVARTGAAVRSTPLAGSVPRAADPREDARRRAALVASAKDADEHRVVVDAVAAALAPVCAELVVPERPEVVGTDTMWHLATPVRGRLTDPADPRCSVLHLAQALHPTPAVCGEPRAAAYALVEALEPRERGALTGVVGWVDGRGDGVAALVIRSAVVRSDGVRLYAGAGIVAGSDPEAEVRETAAKLRTMARALGVPDEVVR